MPTQGRKYVGPMARLSVDAIKRADQMMLLATNRIGSDYETSDPEEQEGWTEEQYLSAMEKAVSMGRGAEFDALIANIVAPILDSVMAQQNPAGE